MEVHINDYPVDIELENEKNITDLVQSISEWARERDLVFYRVYIDEMPFTIDEIPDVDLNTLKKVNFIVQSRADIVFSTMHEGILYADRVLDFIENTAEAKDVSEEEMRNVVTGMSWITEVLRKVIQLLGLEPEEIGYRDGDLAGYIAMMDTAADSIADNGIDDETFHSVKDVFKNIKEIYRMLLLSEDMKNLVIRSIDSPDVLIQMTINVREDLENQLENIERAAVAFQTGRDQEGAERLNKLVDFLHTYIRTCYQIAPVFNINPAEIEVEGLSLEEKNNRLNELLMETVDIMENGDIISLSDILEYEIKPALEGLDRYIDIILEMLQN